MSSSPERRTIHYRGRVQGVGFRYTACRIAERHPVVVGYVQNLDDGRVRLVAEATPDKLDAFLSEVRKAMDHNISDVAADVSAPTGEFSAFQTRF